VETAFSAFQPAPAAARVRATSIVNLIASEDTILRHGAAYLVAQLPEGLCLVDEVLSWNKSYSSMQFATHWSSTDERLHVQAHRTVYMILDQEELSSGESNVESEECVRLEYQVVGARFTRVGERSTPGACDAAGTP
jgi:hypothetical protein